MGRVLVTVHLGRHFRIFGHYDYKVLLDMGYEVHIAANFKDNIDNFDDPNVIKHQIDFSRNPFSIDNFKAKKQLEKLLNQYQFDIVHTQSPSGGAITRLATRKTRKKGTKVIYTAHGFHFFKGAPLKNWIFFYPVELWLSRYTDVLITINKEDFNRAKRCFKSVKVEYIPGVGIDTKKFNHNSDNKSLKRKELGLPGDAFVVLSVGELNRNKNHETIINAISKLNNSHIYYIICGQGILNEYLKSLIKKLDLDKQIKLLGYRKDIAEISKASDVFAFPSFREGLSVSLMEAMASGLPVVCSNIRGNSDLIKNGKNGFLNKPDNIDCFKKSIQKVMDDTELRKEMSVRNIEEIKEYDKDIVKNAMKKLYKDLF